MTRSHSSRRSASPERGAAAAIAQTSALLPNLPLKEVIPRYLEQSKTMGRNAVMKAFRQWLKSFC
ncbi:hypothetical protein VB735_14600 [Halotia wernerae UHCC 0503]|nr:hypothetical protein [Halotia wernerae UHCC 0503]